MNLRCCNLATLLTETICLIVNYKLTLSYFIVLVTFAVSTVIMVHVVKSSSNTLKNNLTKRIYHISHGLLK